VPRFEQACLVRLSDTCPWTSAASGDASMADDWDGDVDQGRGDMNMTSDLGKRHTRSDRLRSGSEYRHSWRHEVRLHRKHPDTYRACVMEAICGSCEDLEGLWGNYGRDSFGMMFGLEGIFHSAAAHNNLDDVGGLALLKIIFVSIKRE
jgi:hypothetical protein